MRTFEEYEKEIQSILEENSRLLDGFEKWLEKTGLTKKTIGKHTENISFYINQYLLYQESKDPREGVHDIDMFLGNWFIRKAMWASETSIRSNAASLKKFYQFMYETGELELESLEELKTLIKEELPEWIDTVRRYDDPSVDLEDIWDY